MTGKYIDWLLFESRRFYKYFTYMRAQHKTISFLRFGRFWIRTDDGVIIFNLLRVWLVWLWVTAPYIKIETRELRLFKIDNFEFTIQY